MLQNIHIIKMYNSFIPPQKSPLARKVNHQPAVAKAVNAKKTTKVMDIKKPKRPLSVYNIYFREERKRILASIADDETASEEVESCDETKEKTAALDNRPKRGRPRGPNYMKKVPHHKIGFEELAKKISSGWPLNKAAYYEKYGKVVEEDKKRYKREMAEYKRNLKEAHLEQTKAAVTEHRSKPSRDSFNEYPHSNIHCTRANQECRVEQHRNQHVGYPSHYYSARNSYEVNDFYAHLHHPEHPVHHSYNNYEPHQEVYSMIDYNAQDMANPYNDPHRNVQARYYVDQRGLY